MRIGGIVKERKLRQNKDKWETMKSSRPRHGNVWDGGDNVDGEILEPRWGEKHELKILFGWETRTENH